MLIQVYLSPLMQVIDQNEEHLPMVELLLDAGAVINETLVYVIRPCKALI